MICVNIYLHSSMVRLEIHAEARQIQAENNLHSSMVRLEIPSSSSNSSFTWLFTFQYG